MKTILSIFVILALTKPIIAQQDSLKDILPLTVGNKWKYSFEKGFRNNFAHSSSEDKGSVEYEIIGKSSYSLGILWKVFQRRDFTRSSFISYNWHNEHIKDSSSFDIIEKEVGWHELYPVSIRPEHTFLKLPDVAFQLLVSFRLDCVIYLLHIFFSNSTMLHYKCNDRLKHST